MFTTLELSKGIANIVLTSEVDSYAFETIIGFLIDCYIFSLFFWQLCTNEKESVRDETMHDQLLNARMIPQIM